MADESKDIGGEREREHRAKKKSIIYKRCNIRVYIREGGERERERERERENYTREGKGR